MKYIKFFPFYLVSLLPMRWLYVLSDLAYQIMYHVIRYRRDVVRSNLENAFPDKTAAELRDIEKGFYKHFCDIWVEAVKLLTMRKSTITKRLIVKNSSLVEEFYQRGKSVIVVAAHHGNWEWFAMLPELVTARVTAFYQKLSNTYFDELMYLIRCRFGCLCIESNQGFRTLAAFQQEGQLTFNFVISDQSPNSGASAHWVKFLHQHTAFLVGADRIAKKLDFPVLFASFEKVKRGKYEVVFSLLEEEPNRIAREKMIEQYAGALESQITRSPELWLWSHRRWKLKRHDVT